MTISLLRAPNWLSGGSSARHVAVAVLLGSAAGAACGWNLTFAAFATLAVLYNGPALTTLVAGTVAFVAAQIGSNLTTALGSFLAEKLGLAAVIESLGHGPFISLLGWHDYELLGSVLLLSILSLPAAHAMARRCAEHDDTDLADETADSSDEIVARGPTSPLLRPWGCTAAMVCTVVTASTLHVVAPQHVGEALLAQLSAAANAPVTADELHYDLFDGSLKLIGVRVRDLDEPGRVALRFNSVTAQVDPGLLLRGRLHAESVTFAGLTYDAVAHTPGPLKLFPSEPTVLREGGADEVRTVDPTQPLEVAGFIRNWNEASSRIAALGRLIGAVECTADLEAAHASAAQRLQASRSPAIEPRDPISGRSLPLVQIKKIRCVELPVAWSLGDDAALELVNLTSRPATLPRGVQLTLDAPSRHMQLAVGFRLTAADRRHEVSFTCDQCAAGDLVDLRRVGGAGLETEANATLALRGRGSISRDRLDLALACDAAGLRPTTMAARFGNLDAAVWRAGIDRLGGLRFDATLTGRWSDPQVQLTPAAAVDQLKHQLRSVGEHQLVKAVEAGRLLVTPPNVVAQATSLVSKTETPVAKPAETTKPAETVVAATAATEATKQPAALKTDVKPAPAMIPQPLGSVAAAAPVPAPIVSATGTTTAAPLVSTAPLATPPSAVVPAAKLATAEAKSTSSTPPLGVPPVTQPQVPSAVPTAVAAPIAAATIAAVSNTVTDPITPPNIVIPSVVAAPAPLPKTATTTAAAPSTSTSTNTAVPSNTATPNNLATPSVATPTVATPSAPVEPTYLPKPNFAAAQVPPLATTTISDGPQPTSTSVAPSATTTQTTAAPATATSSPASLTTSPTASTTGNFAVTPATAIVGLRQPPSVLDPSAAPGPLNWSTGSPADLRNSMGGRGADTWKQAALAADAAIAAQKLNPTGIAAANASPSNTPSVNAAAKPNGATAPTGPLASTNKPTPSKPNNAAPALPFAPRDGGEAVVISDDQANPTEKTASKTYFPRIRKIFTGEPKPEAEDVMSPPEQALAERSPPPVRTPSVVPPQTPLQRQPMESIPETAKAPWYERVFR